jgi:hypothetical protein
MKVLRVAVMLTRATEVRSGHPCYPANSRQTNCVRRAQLNGISTQHCLISQFSFGGSGMLGIYCMLVAVSDPITDLQ